MKLRTVALAAFISTAASPALPAQNLTATVVGVVTDFHGGQEEIFPDAATLDKAAGNATDWLVESKLRNVIIEVANEKQSVRAAVITSRPSPTYVQISDNNRLAPGRGVRVPDAPRCRQYLTSAGTARQAAAHLTPYLQELETYEDPAVLHLHRGPRGRRH